MRRNASLKEVIELRSRITQANNAIIELRMDNNDLAAQLRRTKGRMVLVHEHGTTTIPIHEMALHDGLLSVKGDTVLLERAHIDHTSRLIVFGYDGKLIHEQPYVGLELNLKKGDTLQFTYDIKLTPVIDR